MLPAWPPTPTGNSGLSFSARVARVIDSHLGAVIDASGAHARSLSLSPPPPVGSTAPTPGRTSSVRWGRRREMFAPERRPAIEPARAAGGLLGSELAGARRIAFKGAPTNLVTEMDAQAEALI